MDKCAALQYLKFVNSLKNTKREDELFYEFMIKVNRKLRKNRRKSKNE